MYFLFGRNNAILGFDCNIRLAESMNTSKFTITSKFLLVIKVVLHYRDLLIK